MELPESWRSVKLANIVEELQPGFAQAPSDSGAVGQIRTLNISPDGNLVLDEIKFVSPTKQELEKYSLQYGDVVFNNTNSEEWVGKTAYYDHEENLVFSNHMTRIRVNVELVSPLYLAKYLHYLWFAGYSKQKAKRWISQAGIDQKALSGFIIALPPLEEQQAIVDILQQAEQLRRLRQGSLAKAEKLAAALFLEMFGDPIANPKNWQMKRLSDVVKSLDGGKNVAEASTNTEYKILKVSAVTYGSFMPLESKYLPDDYQFPDSYLVKKGDLLISRANTSELIGATAYVWDTPNNIVLSDKIWRFVWKENVFIEPLFVFYLTKTKSFRSLISQRSTGTSSSMKNITKPKLLSLPIPVPPIEQQEAFAESLKKIEVQRKSLQSQLDKIETFLTFLQSQAFSGKLTETWRQEHPDITSSHVKVNVLTTAKAVNIAYGVSKPRVADYREIGLVDQLSQFQKTVWRYFVNNQGYVPNDFPALIAELPDEITANDQTRLQTTLATLTALGLIAKVSLLDSEGHYTTAYRAVREDDQLDAFKLPPHAVTLI